MRVNSVSSAHRGQISDKSTSHVYTGLHSHVKNINQRVTAGVCHCETLEDEFHSVTCENWVDASLNCVAVNTPGYHREFGRNAHALVGGISETSVCLWYMVFIAPGTVFCDLLNFQRGCIFS